MCVGERIEYTYMRLCVCVCECEREKKAGKGVKWRLARGEMAPKREGDKRKEGGNGASGGFLQHHFHRFNTRQSWTQPLLEFYQNIWKIPR